MQFKIFIESTFEDVDKVIKIAANSYATGGDNALHDFMDKHFDDKFLERFKKWWKLGYYRDYDDHGITMGGTKFYTDDRNPNYRYLFAKIAKEELESDVNLEDYLKEGWRIYAKSGDDGLSQWIADLKPGIISKFRRHLVNQGGAVLRDSGLHYQLAK